MEEDRKKREAKIRLTWKDHVALFVALIQTIMLPAIVLIVILLILIVYSTFVK